MKYLDYDGSVAGIFLFVMIIITVSLIWIFAGKIFDPFIALQGSFISEGYPVSAASTESVGNFTLLWKYGVPIGTIFISGLWLIIVAIRERSSGL